jgi:hypothetical protein
MADKLNLDALDSDEDSVEQNVSEPKKEQTIGQPHEEQPTQEVKNDQAGESDAEMPPEITFKYGNSSIKMVLDDSKEYYTLTEVNGDETLENSQGAAVIPHLDGLGIGTPLTMTIWSPETNQSSEYTTDAPVTESSLPLETKKVEEKTDESTSPFADQTQATIKADYEQKGEDDVDLPEDDEAEQSALDQLSVSYKNVANEFKSRFRNDPEAAETIAEFLNKIVSGNGSNAEAWKDYLKKNGNSRAMVQNKIIPTLVKAFNSKNKGKQIELPKQVNDENTMELTDRNGNGDFHIIVPEGFNGELIDLGDQAISNELGFPAINFNSKLIQSIMSAKDDPKQLKKLMTALLERIHGTKVAKTFITGFSFTGLLSDKHRRSSLFHLIEDAARANGVPMLRKPLKVTSEELLDKTEDEMVSVRPINTLGNRFESVDLSFLAPMYESFDKQSYESAIMEGLFSRNVDDKSAQMFGNDIQLPRQYLTQFYTILTPSGANGLTKYAKFMTKDDTNDIRDTIGEKAEEKIKTSNRNIKDELIKAYLQKKNGVPPFYILVPRAKPTKERLRVCDDHKIGKNVCVKSIDGKNRDAYFIPEDTVKAIFEAG